MSSKLDALFTHIEVLRSREATKVDMTPISTMIDGPRPEILDDSVTSRGDSLFNSDTPAKILQVGCDKAYGWGPKYIYRETSGCNVLYSCECSFGEWKSVGKSDNKKKAKQISAKKLLLQIVEKGCFKQFGIPGSDKNHAKLYVLGLMPTLEAEDAKVVTSAAEMSAENWPGRCIGLCQNSKLSRQPEYTSEEDGLPNDKTFTVTASLKCPDLNSDLSAVGVGRSKKMAKNQAAKNLYEKIAVIFPPKDHKPAGSQDMIQQTSKKVDLLSVDASSSNAVKEGENGIIDDDSEHFAATENKEVSDDQLWKQIQDTLMEIVKTEDHSDGCEDILKGILASKHPAVEKIFDCAGMNFVVAEHDDHNGNFQVYLEMIKRVKNRPQNTFAAEGETEKVARERACWQALQFIYVFGGFSSKESTQKLK